MVEDIGSVISLEGEMNSILEFSCREKLGSRRVEIVKAPSFGIMRIVNGLVRYNPNKDFHGNDFFIYETYTKKRGVVALIIKEYVFKPRARLLIQLGNQLIKNESIALVELAKNSFDADASYCRVSMENVEDMDKGSIIIVDDGFGMGIDIIKNAWLEPGSDNKEIQVKNKEVTKKYGRLPIGEKGIGRFGVHKLGKKIEMISRSHGNDEVVVRIDWDKFENHKYLNDAAIEVFQRTPVVFMGEDTGTKISVSNLTKSWTRGMVRDIFRALNGISTPPTYDIDDIIDAEGTVKTKTSQGDVFEATLITDQPDWIKNIPSLSEILEYSLFFFDIDIDDDRITRFRYKFKPWDRFSDMQGRVITEKDDPVHDLLDLTDPTKRKYYPLEFEGVKIGKIQFKGCVFIRDRFIFKLFNIQQSSVTDFLDRNGGIRVYRNGIRVYDYGEPENDWLALDYRRFNDPGVRLSNNLLLASININRENSSDLIEKTNREGFIENRAYQLFKSQILYSLKLIELLRLEDKRKVDDKYKPDKDSETVLKSIDGLRGYAKEKIKDPEVRKQLKVYVDRIEKNYRFMNDTLMKSASAGLGWSVYVHEIEKIIAEIITVIKRDKASDRLLKLASHLSKLIESYAEILKKTTRSKQDLSKIVDQALFNVEYRLEAHGITIYREDLNKKPIQVVIARNLMVSNIMNLIDNSIYWLDRSKKKDKIIRFDIIELKEGFISLVISDNGMGFSLSPEKMTEPFVSAKPGGMGLGLHIVSEVMASHKGNVSFNLDGQYQVPPRFSDGATVVLSLKKLDK